MVLVNARSSSICCCRLKMKNFFLFSSCIWQVYGRKKNAYKMRMRKRRIGKKKKEEGKPTTNTNHFIFKIRYMWANIWISIVPFTHTHTLVSTFTDTHHNDSLQMKKEKRKIMMNFMRFSYNYTSFLEFLSFCLLCTSFSLFFFIIIIILVLLFRFFNIYNLL